MAGARDRGRTGTAVKPRDFKSLVSTNFTTRANVVVGFSKAERRKVRILAIVGRLRKKPEDLN